MQAIAGRTFSINIPLYFRQLEIFEISAIAVFGKVVKIIDELTTMLSTLLIPTNQPWTVLTEEKTLLTPWQSLKAISESCQSKTFVLLGVSKKLSLIIL